MKKNNAWNIRRLVDESFVPSTQRIILKIVGFHEVHMVRGSHGTLEAVHFYADIGRFSMKSLVKSLFLGKIWLYLHRCLFLPLGSQDQRLDPRLE